MLKLVKGKQLQLDLDVNDTEFQWREKIGSNYLEMKLNEGKNLAIFYFNFLLLLASIAFTIFLTKIFIIAVLLSAYSSYKSHDNYLDAWSKRNKYGRKTMVRIDIEKRPAIIAGGPKVPWINLKEG